MAAPGRSKDRERRKKERERRKKDRERRRKEEREYQQKIHQDHLSSSGRATTNQSFLTNNRGLVVVLVFCLFLVLVYMVVAQISLHSY